MNYENTFQYIFAIILAGIGGYGFINGIDLWGSWLVGSLVYLYINKRR